MKEFLIFWLWGPVVGWAALIFYLSSIPGLKTDLGFWDLVLRKLAHVTEFGILTLLLVRAIRHTWVTLSWQRLLIWSGAVSLAYALSDEFHQRFVPSRGPSLIDVGIDAMGILGALYYFYKKHHAT